MFVTKVAKLAAILGSLIVAIQVFPPSASALSIKDSPLLSQTKLSVALMKISLRQQAIVFLVDGTRKSGQVREISEQVLTLGRGHDRVSIPWDRVVSVEFRGAGLFNPPRRRGEGIPVIRLEKVPLQALEHSPEGKLVINLKVIPGILEDEILEIGKLMNQYQYMLDVIQCDSDRSRMMLKLTGYLKEKE